MNTTRSAWAALLALAFTLILPACNAVRVSSETQSARKAQPQVVAIKRPAASDTVANKNSLAQSVGKVFSKINPFNWGKSHVAKTGKGTSVPAQVLEVRKAILPSDVALANQNKAANIVADRMPAKASASRNVLSRSATESELLPEIKALAAADQKLSEQKSARDLPAEKPVTPVVPTVPRYIPVPKAKLPQVSQVKPAEQAHETSPLLLSEPSSVKEAKVDLNDLLPPLSEGGIAPELLPPLPFEASVGGELDDPALLSGHVDKQSVAEKPVEEPKAEVVQTDDKPKEILPAEPVSTSKNVKLLPGVPTIRSNGVGRIVSLDLMANGYTPSKTKPEELGLLRVILYGSDKLYVRKKAKEFEGRFSLDGFARDIVPQEWIGIGAGVQDGGEHFVFPVVSFISSESEKITVDFAFNSAVDGIWICFQPAEVSRGEIPMLLASHKLEPINFGPPDFMKADKFDSNKPDENPSWIKSNDADWNDLTQLGLVPVSTVAKASKESSPLNWPKANGLAAPEGKPTHQASGDSVGVWILRIGVAFATAAIVIFLLVITGRRSDRPKPKSGNVKKPWSPESDEPDAKPKEEDVPEWDKPLSMLNGANGSNGGSNHDKVDTHAQASPFTVVDTGVAAAAAETDSATATAIAEPPPKVETKPTKPKPDLSGVAFLGMRPTYKRGAAGGTKRFFRKLFGLGPKNKWESRLPRNQRHQMAMDE